jgi:hypothetical protein
MKTLQFIHIFACLAMFPVLNAQAGSPLPAPNWDAQEARHAAAQADVIDATKPLFELARAGRDDAVLAALAEVAGRDSWSEPARERILHAFALGLSDLDPNAVGPEVIEWLLAYEPRTLVPHEDHPSAGVPLYRIGAAAAGTRNAWARLTAAAESARLLQRGDEIWLGAYLAAGAAGRRGLVEGLDQGGPERLKRLAEHSVERLPVQPELTPVAVQAGLLLSDAVVLRRAVVSGGGPGLAPALRSTARTLDEIERAEVLRHAIAHAPPVNASLAIAELAPGLLHQPEVAELLFKKLGERDIGPAAALALSASKSPAVRERLEELAGADTGLGSTRAAIALESGRNAAGGARP